MAEVEVYTAEQIKEFDRMLTTNPEMKRFAHKVLSSVLRKARSAVSKSARNMLKGSDPRKAYQAVKSATYKRILGGSVSILARRKRSGYAASLPSTTRKRSKRTTELLSYWGTDRGFILRFLNSGTHDRTVRGFNAGSIKRQSADDRPRRKGGYRSGNIGFRGRIDARNWFDQAANPEMEKAAEQFCMLIYAEIERINQEYINNG